MQVEKNEFGMQFVIPHTHYVFVSRKVPTFHHFLLPFISMHARIEKSQVAQTKLMLLVQAKAPCILWAIISRWG